MKEIIYKSCEYNIEDGKLFGGFKSFSLFCIIMFHFYRTRTAIKSGLLGENKQQLEIDLFRDVLTMCYILSFSKSIKYRNSWEKEAKNIQGSQMVRRITEALEQVDTAGLNSYLEESNNFKNYF